MVTQKEWSLRERMMGRPQYDALNAPKLKPGAPEEVNWDEINNSVIEAAKKAWKL